MKIKQSNELSDINEIITITKIYFNIIDFY